MLGKNKEIPTERVMELQEKGAQGSDIINQLQNEGYNHNQITNAMDQAHIKSELASPSMSNNQIGPSPDIPVGLLNAPSPSGNSSQDFKDMQPAPDFSSQDYSDGSTFAPEPLERGSYDAIEEIAESIIKEKWDELVRNVGDIRLWKERMDIDLQGVKQELVRTQEKFENLQKALMGKVKEYSDGVTDISTEMRALEKVLENILSPLTKSVRDLREVTEKITTKKRATTRKRKVTKKKTSKKK